MSPRKNPEAQPSETTPDLPATTHRFVGETPLIFPLHHGDIHVVRANPVLDDDGNPVEESGLIVLHNGDEVTLPDDFEHALLELINPPIPGDTDQPDTGDTDQPAPTSETEQS